MVEVAAAALWAGAVALLLVRSPHGGRRVYQWMALAVVALLARWAWVDRAWILALAAAAEAVVKIGWVPRLLSGGTPPAGDRYGAHGLWGAAGLVWGALAFTGVGLDAGYRLPGPWPGVRGLFLATGLVLLWGLVMRRDTWVQAVLFLGLDLAAGALALLEAGGMPPLAEAAALADLAGMAAILAGLERTNRIRFGIVDTAELKELKG